MTEYQQSLGKWTDDSASFEGAPWTPVQGFTAGTCAEFDPEDNDRYLLLLTGFWTPVSRPSLSIQRHVYRHLLRQGYSNDTSIYAVDKDLTSPRVYEFKLGQFAPDKCRVLDAPDGVPSITSPQHTVPIRERVAEYRELSEEHRAFIHSIPSDQNVRTLSDVEN